MNRLGAYALEGLLGEGAMGEVYRGVHVALGRPVAIKVLKPAVAADESMLQRFFAEARAVNVIRHENIVDCTDMVSDPQGRSYIVMELLEGGTLTQAIERGGPMDPARAVKIAAQIADAIGAAHDKGIVHRDLKPDNIFLIRRAGTSDYVKVLDFGIARLRPEYGLAATQTGALIGTPSYMSPEQAKGEKAGPPSDIYALGVIVYQMLTGKVPFRADSLPELLMAHIKDPPPPIAEVVPGISPALAAVVTQALAKAPGDRHASMSEFRAALIASVESPAAAPSLEPARAPAVNAAASVAPSPSPSRSRRVWLFGIAAAAIVAGSATAIVLARGGQRSTGTTPSPRPATAAAPAAAPAPATSVGAGDARLLVRSIPSESTVFLAPLADLGVAVKDPSDPELRASAMLRLLGVARLGDDMTALAKLGLVAGDRFRRGKTPIEIRVDPGTYVAFVSVPGPSIPLTELEDDSLHGPTIDGTFGEHAGRIYLLELTRGDHELVQLWQPKTATMEDLDRLYPAGDEFVFDEVEFEHFLAANVNRAHVDEIIGLLRRGGKVAYRQDSEHRLLMQANKASRQISTVLRYRGRELAKLNNP